MDAAPPARRNIAAWLTVVAIVLLALPTLVFSYLPMTDLPQHLAVAAILDGHGDPATGFAEYYRVDWFRVPYVLVYALTVALTKVLPLKLALHVVVFASVIAYPLAIVALLRALRKPVWFALLAVPLAYNRAFFWGFINFNLSIGLALAAFTLFVSPTKSRRRDVALAVLCLLTALCHIYGLALVLTLLALYAVVGGFSSLRARWWTLLPPVCGVVLWALGARSQAGYGVHIDPPLVERVRTFSRELLGGYQDASEPALLLLLLVAVVLLVWPSVPTNRARWKALVPVERVVWLVAVGNLALYLILPQATWTAKFIHFRHAFLACAMVPLLASPMAGRRMTLLVRAMPVVAACAAVLNAWAHLMLFDREARRIDPVLEALPARPRLASLVFDPNGDVMATFPYLHAAAYGQAKRGGIITMTFPRVFWNLPVTMRGDARVPATPEGFEWNPNLFNARTFGQFYDYVLVRIPGTRALATTESFPFELVAASPPWQLYRRR